MSTADNLNTIAENVPKVYNAGKQARDDEWWNTYLAPMKAGKPSNYLFAGAGWNGNTFYPNQDIVPLENAQGLFNRFSWNTSVTRIDLTQRLEECGVILDISAVTSNASMFEYAFITRVPSLNCNSTKYSTLNGVFRGARYLVTIDELIIRNDGTNVFAQVFDGCTALKKITITGVIGRSISFADCPLSVESLKNIAGCLKDYSLEDTSDNHYKYTLTVKASAFEELDAEGATAEYNGAACTWAELIDNKKWNLTQA